MFCPSKISDELVSISPVVVVVVVELVVEIVVKASMGKLLFGLDVVGVVAWLLAEETF